jgi:hypothetical protein
MKNLILLSVIIIATILIPSQGCVSVYEEIEVVESDSIHIDGNNEEVDNDCTCNGFKLYGKVQFVDAFPDLKVQVVDAFPDLKVKVVDAFPDECGEWEVVDAFPDIKIQIVDAFPDIKIQYVDAFPGIP